MDSSELIPAKGPLNDIKHRLKSSQIRATLSANAELIQLFWDIDFLIASKQQDEGWGSGVIRRLATEVKSKLSEQKGFSVSNLKRIVQFFREYSDCLSIPTQPVRELDDGENEPNKQLSANPEQPVPESRKIQPGHNNLLSLSWGHNIDFS